MLYKALLRPILFLKDPEKTHEQTLSLLATLSFLHRPLSSLLRVTDPRLRVQIGPLTFPNPVGLAAGFDKNARAIGMWTAFGFGFFEIGAVTALAQPGNPKPRVFRLPEDEALINRLGFNNDGAEAIARRLFLWQTEYPRPRVPMGINIGRSRSVENKDAVADYLFTFEKLFALADYFTLNVSSPNTPNLRELQEKKRLADLLAAIGDRNRHLSQETGLPPKPIMVKIAPDLGARQLDEVIEAMEAGPVSAVIATNATALLRENLRTRTEEEGGLSGRPLKALATSLIRHINQATGGRLPIIGCGGIFTAEDAYEKITAGASAVQLYTGFVFEGPAVVKRINRGLLDLLQRDGFDSVAAAVGSRAR